MNSKKKSFYQKMIPRHLEIKIENGRPEALRLGFFGFAMLASWIFFTVSFFEYKAFFSQDGSFYASFDAPSILMFVSMQFLFLLNYRAFIKCSENLFLSLASLSLLTLCVTHVFLEKYYELLLATLMWLPFVFLLFRGWHILLGLASAAILYGCNFDLSFLYKNIDHVFLWSGFILGVLFLGLVSSWLVKDVFKNLLFSTEIQNKGLKQIIRGLVHDLSNPVSVISGSLELLENNHEITSSQKVLDRLHRMRLACEVLEGVLLEAKRNFIASDRNSSSKEESFCNLRECLDASLLILDKKIRDKNIQMIFGFQIDLIAIKGEKTLVISHILTNILSNCIKFSYPEGKIYLSIYHLEQHVALSIKDEGRGIPEQQLHQILSLDETISHLGTLGESGTGYGLLLVKHHIEGAGGWVSIESKTKDLSPDSHGTTVTLYFLKANQERKRA